MQEMQRIAPLMEMYLEANSALRISVKVKIIQYGMQMRISRLAYQFRMSLKSGRNP